MENSNFWSYIIFGIVMLHILIGFGYAIYKLSPKKEKNDDTPMPKQ